jgi:hypothetical protein
MRPPGSISSPQAQRAINIARFDESRPGSPRACPALTRPCLHDGRAAGAGKDQTGVLGSVSRAPYAPPPFNQGGGPSPPPPFQSPGGSFGRWPTPAGCLACRALRRPICSSSSGSLASWPGSRPRCWAWNLMLGGPRAGPDHASLLQLAQAGRPPSGCPPASPRPTVCPWARCRPWAHRAPWGRRRSLTCARPSRCRRVGSSPHPPGRPTAAICC